MLNSFNRLGITLPREELCGSSFCSSDSFPVRMRGMFCAEDVRESAGAVPVALSVSVVNALMRFGAVCLNIFHVLLSDQSVSLD